MSFASARGRTALVVEDDVAVGRMLERHLVRAGYAVILANGEREGLRLAPGVDVAIVDLGLGEGSGADLCERLRDAPSTAALPIIVLTARADLETKLRLFAAGADDYVTKPFEPLELLARIEATARRAGTPPIWRRIGELEISDGGDAALNGVAIPFTAAERDVMARLAARYPGTTPHDELRHGTSRRSEVSSQNVTEVLVGRVRRKLAAAGGGVELRAVRGVGYVLRVSRQEGMGER